MWLSNGKVVLGSVPPARRAKNVKEIDLNYEARPIERALGVSWDVESDYVGFKTALKDQLLTRRGLLSMVSAINDPLGLLRSFTIRAKM
ncbi:hypothetical protein HOLleu_39315 [Holothuria leucospilota]|uniref:Uncharacterized protein n=1 Tax=Holothuria leucospilota TaxID=206669 RepID=A0A9Q1BE14_HOLLE|nr:hypothetical protein HOLleu_39315 [Holothuria leucospilota]